MVSRAHAPQQLQEWFNNKDFYSQTLLKDGKKLNRQGNEKALQLFHSAAKRVPAYKDFLKKNKISSKSIQSIQDFKKLPFTDKKNYIDQYPLEKLVWDGKLDSSFVINASSGTTGKPYYWPCSHKEFIQGAVLHKMLYYTFFNIDKKRTLVIVCFGMGTWVAGIYTFLSTYLLSIEKKNISVITPGFNKDETIRILSLLAPKYEQIIIAGYPTYIKDVLEQCNSIQKIKGRVKFIFAGEGITETWRAYVHKLVQCNNYYKDSISVLGSADATFMGFETPISILIRKQAQKDLKFNKSLFNSERVPSLVCYFPSQCFFEHHNNELILTMDRSIPLIHYNIHDIGGVLSYNKMMKKAQGNKNFSNSLSSEKSITGSDLIKLPFVYLFGRDKFTATIYAANIYPENVKDVLSDKKIRRYTTGKFSLETKYNDKQNHYLLLNIELKESVKLDKKIQNMVEEVFVTKVSRINSEYHRVLEEYGNKVKPIVKLYKYGEPHFFPSGQLSKTS
ncbi:hypothetical protein A3A93_05845 [Candidatus Roizmanbacteria bacterium RIFCSPLOWO2_01_FULL_38_12]|uniref:AMP-dependent synthetase/ligase domain-containing protein n=1 Tax=Candidatus Roizmanbacteria bacterium RIFCSPLOWO2_01_FULL_38_12 TaxID=1802061 RepID=A0A1F7IVC0_9BACT|nr:MAG: hypothetical protein A3F59_03485 [Candidatus Roizmanbacteria bacterium RIFCSPHIGHO2_12_FULL_38_13]OGK47283.1 MAG: hypothetical protein A3A93_05845 [Candidatus Roizmanbacteria bacterium RIFCSPLOWO2_01_FULL_38_12]